MGGEAIRLLGEQVAEHARRLTVQEDKLAADDTKMA